MSVNKSDKILLTGGTGFLGSYVLKQLINAGYTNIHAIKRSTSKMDLVEDVQDRVSWSECDILDIASLEDLVRNMDCIVHAAAFVSMDPRDHKRMHQVNGEGTANLVNLALDHKIKKFVHVSSIAALGRKENNVLMDEEIRWEESPSNSQYGVSKYNAEMEVWRGASEGLNICILNPSLILGAGFWKDGTPAIFTRVDEGVAFFPTGTTGVVDVRDVADACEKALSGEMVNERYIISAENVSYKDLIQNIAKALGAKVPKKPLPEFLKNVSWRGEKIRAFLFRKKPLITKETIVTTSHFSRYDNQKSIDQLKMKYRSLDSTINETATAYTNSNGIVGQFS